MLLFEASQLTTLLVKWFRTDSRADDAVVTSAKDVLLLTAMTAEEKKQTIKPGRKKRKWGAIHGSVFFFCCFFLPSFFLFTLCPFLSIHFLFFLCFFFFSKRKEKAESKTISRDFKIGLNEWNRWSFLVWGFFFRIVNKDFSRWQGERSSVNLISFSDDFKLDGRYYY